MLRYLVWDLDGTLLDTYPGIAGAFLAALRELGHDAGQDYVQSLAQVSFGHCTQVLADEFGLDGEELYARFLAHYRTLRPEDQHPFTGVRAVLERAHATGANFGLTHRARRSVDELLAAHNLAQYFRAWVAGDDGFPRKPDPAGLISLLETYRLPREETLVVGDRSLDIEAGYAADVPTCLFGGQEVAVEPTYRIDSFESLLALLPVGAPTRS